ncbi:hypothetical protein JTB14_000782 [Gonioctena quinquepunctata]|nr:hypothetical protein JTB14_000782 [Gonioctena quinquepunctata]
MYKPQFNEACNYWMIINLSKTITIYEIPELLGKAIPLAFVSNKIISGFQSTGIWPLKGQIYSDYDFLAFAVTDRPPSVQQITNILVGIPTQQISIETAETVTQPVSDETAEMTPQQVANGITEVIPTSNESQLPSCLTSSEVPSLRRAWSPQNKFAPIFEQKLEKEAEIKTEKYTYQRRNNY